MQLNSNMYFLTIVYNIIDKVFIKIKINQDLVNSSPIHHPQSKCLDFNQYYNNKINIIFICNRAFIAWEDQIPVNGDSEHKQRANLVEYMRRLAIDDRVLPDPFSLHDGWTGEENMKLWPNLYFHDIAEYLRIKTPSELFHKLCNEYKQGKAFRYIIILSLSV